MEKVPLFGGPPIHENNAGGFIFGGSLLFDKWKGFDTSHSMNSMYGHDSTPQ